MLFICPFFPDIWFVACAIISTSQQDNKLDHRQMSHKLNGATREWKGVVGSMG
jgi:hypothetical protein